jgi:hypothetical protein
MAERGMTTRDIELSAGPDGQAEQHGMRNVRAHVFRDRGDGWVLNEWSNAHLAGSVVQYSVKRTKLGRQPMRSFMSLEAAALKQPHVDLSLDLAQAKLAGLTDQSGDVAALASQRQLLLHWFELQPEDKAGIRNALTGIAESRERVMNPVDLSIALRARRAAKLSSPGAVLASTERMTRDMLTRIEELQTDRSISGSRAQRIARWLIEENCQINKCDQLLSQIATDADEGLLPDLRFAARAIRFRVQPFNHMSYLLRRAPYRIEDAAVLDTTQIGLEFMRYRQYLGAPHRFVADVSVHTRNFKAVDQEALIGELDDRSELIDSMGLSGAYQQLGWRYLEATQALRSSLKAGDIASAKRSARVGRHLLRYHCLPEDTDANKAVWYRYQP